MLGLTELIVIDVTVIAIAIRVLKNRLPNPQ